MSTTPNPTPAVKTVLLRNVLQLAFFLLMMLVLVILALYHFNASQASWVSSDWLYVAVLADMVASSYVITRIMSVFYSDGYADGYAAAQKQPGSWATDSSR